MRLKDIFIGTALSLSLIGPLAANASSDHHPQYKNQISTGKVWGGEEVLQSLSLKNSLNGELEAGSYLFGDYNHAQKGFFDSWSFSLAETSDVTISLFDVALPGGDGFLTQDGTRGGKHQKSWQQYFSALLDNKFLTASLFDQEGVLIGSLGENGMLSALGLESGNQYTLAVSGKAAGLMGGIYYGSLDVNQVAHVPLGDTLPLFGSALLVLALRARRKNEKTTLVTA